jgi:hypothetical protein
MVNRDELPENKIDCPICGEIVELDDFDFIEDMCIDCANKENEEMNRDLETNEELERESDTAKWVQKQNIT